MTNKLNDFIKSAESTKFATNAGLAMHAKLQHIRLGDKNSGDPDLIQKIINSGDDIKTFFTNNAQTEVPIAGFVNGRFISRRIDRMVVDDITKTVRVLDYKTDINPENLRQKYKSQLGEYIDLLKQIYPEYKISGYILWLHNWVLEQI